MRFVFAIVIIVQCLHQSVNGLPRSAKGVLQNANVIPNKIVGGADAQEGRYPFFTSLLIPTCSNTVPDGNCNAALLALQNAANSELGIGEDGNFCLLSCDEPDATTCCACCDGGDRSKHDTFCGGSLIAPNVVLTAAHCFLADSSLTIIFPDRVKINIFELSDLSEAAEQFAVVEYALHPNFNPNTLSNDFMLLRLEGNSAIQPVIIDDGSNELNGGDPLTVIGFGDTIKKNGIEYEYEFRQAFPDTLQEVTLNFHPNNLCNADYGGGILNNMLCTFTENKDSCQGDSGGPLFIKGADASEDVQVGVVSFGIGCAVDFPGVYSRISAVYPWIKGVLNCFDATLRNDDTSIPAMAVECSAAGRSFPVFELTVAFTLLVTSFFIDH